MASDEQFSLCWNNFHANMSAGFHGLLSRGDLVDVTLAAEGRLLQAHKLVLSVCSPYFQEMFKMNPTQHPIVFLKDVSHSALRDLLQFMYQGEVNVKQEELASFISTAEQLQVKGLTGNQNEESSTPSKPKPTSRPGPRSSQQRQSVMTKIETDLDSKPSSTPVAVKRPNRPSIASNNSSSSQSGPAKRKCVDPLEAGPSGSAKEEFVTIPDEDENAVAPKMEPEYVNESVWDDDDDGANNEETNFGEDDSNMEMSGFDGSTTDANLTGTGEGGAVGDAQGASKSNWESIYFTNISDDNFRCNVCQNIIHKPYPSDLADHIQNKHIDIYELHKDGDDEIMGFQIEFLHLNVMKSDELNRDSAPGTDDGSIKQKKLDRILDCEHNYLVLPEKKALALGEGRKRSWVWKYFEKLSNYVFRCNLCNAALSIKGCNTNNMNRHVRSKHPSIYKMETSKRYCSEQVSEIGSEVEIPELNWPDHADEPKNNGKEYIICEVKRRKPKPRSWIWDYFMRVSDTLAQCKLCSRNICHGGNATGNMNRHMKMLHKDVYVNYVLVAGDEANISKNEEEWAWIWKLFANDEDDYYKCKICMFKLTKSEDISNSVDLILNHLKSEHGVVSHDQIITSVECDNIVDECTVAVDFLKDSEDI